LIYEKIRGCISSCFIFLWFVPVFARGNAGVLNLEIEISGTAQTLADELAKAGRYILDTEQINKNQITISLLQKEGE
jgi:hypothetical protein